MSRALCQNYCVLSAYAAIQAQTAVADRTNRLCPETGAGLRGLSQLLICTSWNPPAAKEVLEDYRILPDARKQAILYLPGVFRIPCQLLVEHPILKCRARPHQQRRHTARDQRPQRAEQDRRR
jgi:hypothetical protein